MSNSEESFSVSYLSPAHRIMAEAFADKHQFMCVPYEAVNTELTLLYSDNNLALHDTIEKTTISIDFLQGNMAHRKQFGGGRGQSIAKAIGLKSGVQAPQVLDATAGLARDAYVLASLSCRITMLEQSPVIAELVKDAIERALSQPDFQKIFTQGFTLINDDAVHYMQQLDSKNYPDVVYLDPMFPARKKSAQVKKDMQILQKLVAHHDNNAALLAAALQCARKRVVVKRPKGAPSLNDHQPSMTIESKKMRYDVYVLASMKD